MDLLIQLVISIGVLSVVLKLVSGEDGPRFPEIIKKVIFISIAVMVSGLFYGSKHFLIVLPLNFIILWVLLSTFLRINRLKITFACLLHLVLMLAFARLTR